MMRVFILCICVAFFFTVNAQVPSADSLKTLLARYPKRDSTRVVRLVQYTYAMFFTDAGQMMPYADEALDIAKTISNPTALSKAYWAKGLASQYGLNNPAIAIEFYTKAMDADPTNTKEQLTNLSNIATVFYNQKQYDQALLYYHKALAMLSKVQDKKPEAQLLMNMGNAFYDNHESDSAKPLFQKSLLLASQTNNRLVLAGSSNALAYVLFDENKFSMAQPHAYDAMQLAKEIHNALLYVNSLTLLSMIKSGLNQADSALVYGKLALAAAEQVQSMQFKRQAWEALALAYEKKGTYKKAYEAAVNTSRLNDSLLSDQSKQEVVRMEMRYEQEKKDAILNAQHTAEIKQQHTTRNFIIGGAALVFVSALLLFLSYKRRRDAVTKRNDAELKAHIADTEMKVMRLQMNPHFIFNSLNSISNYIHKNSPQEAGAYLTKFANVMRRTLENSEQQTIPLEEDLKTLELYMQLEAKRLNQKFTYEINVAPDIDKEATLVPPMIFQPFVENSIWHGIAAKEGQGHIVIDIKKEDEMLYCLIDDDGVGRQTESSQAAPKEKQSLGMKITKARIEILNKLKGANASVQLVDKPQGLSAQLKLPLETAF